MAMTDEMRDALLRNVGGAALKDIARKHGMITMRESGIRKVLEGDTTVEEISRVLLNEEAADAPVAPLLTVTP